MEKIKPPGSEFKAELIRGLSLFDATTLAIGSMIGSGIFLSPSIMCEYLHTPGLIIGLWILAGILTLFGAMAYGEMAALYPCSGGQYVYLSRCYSPLFGFLFGWTVFLAIYTGFIAAVGVAFAKYLGSFIPLISENTILLSVPLWGEKSLNFNTAQGVGILSIAVLTWINCRGLRWGALVQNLFTVLKLIAVLLLIVFAFNCTRGDWQNLTPVLKPILPEGGKLTLFAAMAVAMSKAVFAYDAWYSATFTGDEIKQAKKNLPHSLVLSTLLVMVIYTLTTAAYFYLVPVQQAAMVPDNKIAAAAAQTIWGSPGVYLISAAILISTFGCNNGLILSGARVYYAMAKDGLFFAPVAKIHPRFHTPVTALILQAVWASLLTLTNTYSDLLTYTAFASIFFGILTVAGIFVLRKKQPQKDRCFKVAGYPWVPIIYIIISLCFLIFLLQGDFRNSGLGILIILSGIPVYFYWKRKLKS